MPGVLYERAAVLGCGLIGSSLLRAMQEKGVARELVAVDPSPAVRQRVEALGIADLVLADNAEAAAKSDLVILAAPSMSIVEVAPAVAAAMRPGATLTDVGSVKGAVAEAFALAPAHLHAVPGHPIAGTERSGPDAGFAELFDGRWTILCPLDRPEDDAYALAVAKLSTFWRTLGSTVELMDARHHDLVLAVTSHLPHLIAYNIVGTAADLEQVARAEVMKFSAGGFRDFTRIAASDPVMWRDVFLLNKEAVLEVLGRFTEDLQALSRAIRWGEGDKLQELFSRTREIRRGIVAAGQESPEPNFGRDRGKH
jgi:cyclohexadieny/prephenate dehydrogenase